MTAWEWAAWARRGWRLGPPDAVERALARSATFELDRLVEELLAE